MKQQVLGNERKESKCIHTRLERGQQSVNIISEKDFKDANLSKRTKCKRDHYVSSLELVLVAFSMRDGYKLRDIRPKRTRDILERA
jgi:hypothetical protein